MRLRLLFPALSSSLIGATPFNPARAVGGVFLLPERRAGFQVIHDEVAGIEGCLAVGTGGADKDDWLAWLQATDAVDDLDSQQRPALRSLLGNLAKGLIGHAGEVFEKHAADFAPLVEVTHIADKADHRANAQVGSMQGVKLNARIEGL